MTKISKQMETTKCSIWSKSLIIFLLALILSPSWGQTPVALAASKTGAWAAPKSQDALQNPLKDDPAAVLEGKKIFTATCAICHGETGKGNGAASVALDPRPANFLSINVRNESDGAIFWKMTQGRPPMASYKTLLTETQRWQLVEYIRKLEEKK